MASTLITTNADALKRAARELSKQSEGLTSNRVLNTLSAAIAGPGRNWGAITGAPTGHYVQPGLHMPQAAEPSVVLHVEGKFSIPFVSRAEALEAFDVLVANADNRDAARKSLADTGYTPVHHASHPIIAAWLFNVGASRAIPILRPLHDESIAWPGIPLTEQVVERLRAMVAQRKTVVVCGRTGIGKSTLLEHLSHGVPEGDRIACVEMYRELKLANRQTTYHTSGNPSLAVAQDYLKLALISARISKPDWLVVGELTCGEVMESFLRGSISGQGGMATMHAAGTREALVRLEESMVRDTKLKKQECQQLIGEAVDVVVHLSRPERPTHIEAVEVRGYKDGAFDIAPIDL
jgi:energy-coupling factor transporter ATP-binding protein EcfA2